MKHIDEWIEEMAMFGSEQEKYAAFFFHLKRLPAFMTMGFEPYTNQFKLFCDYNGKTYRVTGASRMGDVWLAKNFEQDHGYDERVDVELCSNWRKEAKE